MAVEGRTQIGTEWVRTLEQTTQAGDEAAPSAKNVEPVVLADPNTPGNLAAVRADGTLQVNLTSSAGNVAIVTGTLSAAQATPVASTTTSTSQIVLDVSTMGNMGVGISTAAFNGTLTFEVSPIAVPTANDWYTIDLNPLSASYPGGGVIAMNVSAQTNRMYEGGLFTPKWAKVRLSALTSGSVGIALGAGPGWVESNPMLTASNANIGRAGPQTSSTSNPSSVTPAASSYTLLAANANRVGYKITNDSNVDCLVFENAGTASATAYSFRLRAGGYYESSGTNMVWTGAVTAIGMTAGTTTAAAATSGACRVTEFV